MILLGVCLQVPWVIQTVSHTVTAGPVWWRKDSGGALSTISSLSALSPGVLVYFAARAFVSDSTRFLPSPQLSVSRLTVFRMQAKPNIALF